jgi:hypothetical protein
VQHVNATVKNAGLFSNPRNLQKITPEGMGFQITDFDQNQCILAKLFNTK